MTYNLLTVSRFCFQTAHGQVTEVTGIVKGGPAIVRKQTYSLTIMFYLISFNLLLSRSQQVMFSCEKHLNWFSSNSSDCHCVFPRHLSQFSLSIYLCCTPPFSRRLHLWSLCSTYRKLHKLPLTRSDGRLGVSQLHHLKRWGRAFRKCYRNYAWSREAITSV